jgi:hypothetical protein
MTRTRFAVALAVALFVGAPVWAQPAPAPAVTLADYQRAESFLGYRTAPLVLNAGVRPTWLPDGRFWYRTHSAPRARSSCWSTRRDVRRHRRSTMPGCSRRCRPPPAAPTSGRGSHSRPLSSPTTARRWCSRSASAATPATWRARLYQCRAPGAPFRSAVARRRSRRVHPRLEPVGARHRHRAGDGAHQRRRQGLRLRHRQCRLDEVQRPARREVVARFEKARHLPADQRGVGEMYIVDTRRSGHVPAWTRGNTRFPATRWSR